jgi:hypothetical protein
MSNIIPISGRLRDGREVKAEADFQQWVYEYLDDSRNRLARIGPQSISSRRGPGSWWNGAMAYAASAATRRMPKPLLKPLANSRGP